VVDPKVQIHAKAGMDLAIQNIFQETQILTTDIARAF
jgi:hypothetical protein